jgi:hypothetical protein
MESKSTKSSGLDVNWLEVNCQRNLEGAAFASGVQDFNFSVGGRFAANLSKSYFRFGSRLRGADGTTAPASVENIARADQWVDCLYDNLYMRAGGADTSSIVSYSSQAGVCKRRLSNSAAWLNTVGKSAYGVDPDFASRVNSSAADGMDTNINKRRISLGPATATVALASSTGIVTGVNTLFTGNAVAVGDELVIKVADDDIRRYVISTVTSNTSLIVNIDGSVDIAATAIGTTSYAVSHDSNPSLRKNETYTLWVPPIGIFDYTGGVLGSGDYRIQMNPRSDFAKAAIEALTDKVTGTDYTFEITSVRFYLCIERSSVPATNVEKIYLREMQVQTKTLSTGAASSNLDFSVPPSTKQICIFAQSNLAGSDNRFPLSKFKTIANRDENLNNLQLTYANVNKPSTNWSSEFTTGATDSINYMTQRYNDTNIASGLRYSEGGAQSIEDWLKSGPMYLFDFERDSQDRSVHLQLQMKYGNTPADSRVFVVSFYTRVVEITTTDGYISNVVTLSV